MKEDPKRSYAILENILILKKSHLFSAVSTGELRAVAEVVEELTFQEGDTIVKENDLGDSLYLLKKGTVRIAKNVNGTEQLNLAELHHGECFGEMSVVDDEVRSASAFAKEECIILRINREDLIDVIMACPSIGVELLKIFVKRLRTANTRIEQLSSESKRDTTKILVTE